MEPIKFTQIGQSLLFLTILLFLIAYLFETIAPALCATLLLLFLVYTKIQFKANIKPFTIERTIVEQPRFVNHPIHIKTRIHNTGGHLYLTAEDTLPPHTQLLKGSNTTTHLLTPNETLTLDYQLQFQHRGTHTFTTIAMHLQDHTHLYTTHTDTKAHTELLIHSDPQEIQKAKRIATRKHIDITLPSHIGTDTLHTMEGIRDYLPGDLLRDIEWKATARLQKMMTKKFEKTETIQTLILLDCSRNMRRTTPNKPSKLEHATILTLHLTKILQNLRHPTGLITYDEHKTLTTTPPTYTHTHIYNQLTTLPHTIPLNEYPTTDTNDTTDTQKDTDKHTQHFLQTIYPYLAKGKRTIKKTTQATGIYDTIKKILTEHHKKHLIILTDMETNLTALQNAITLAHTKHHKIWLLNFFSPTYHLTKNELTKEHLEHLYHLQDTQEKTLRKLKKHHIDIMEITPYIEGGHIIETIRRKQTP